MRATRPAHPILLDLIILIIFGENTNYRTPHCALSPASVTSSLLGLNILLSILLSNTLELYSSLNVGDQVSHQYETTSKIILLFALLFTFLGSRQQTKILKSMIASIY
jgi:hypothetical protein